MRNYISTRWTTLNSLRAGTVHQHQSVESSTPRLIAQIKGWLTKKGTRWQQSLLITSVVCPTSTFRSQQMQMKLLKQSWPLRDMLPSSRSKSRVIKLTMAGLQRTSSWQLSRKQVKPSLSVESMLIFRMLLLQKEGSGLCKTKQEATMLIHSQHRWPKAIDAHLWPYALRVANEGHNSTPTIGREDHKSPFELFARSEVTPNLNLF
ncbi:hypothetical protein MHU86_6467 [Fragilaria crotonensis]|nr:hypothetical protein MHU86_6467 [Fragilaria crotonensis]